MPSPASGTATTPPSAPPTSTSSPCSPAPPAPSMLREAFDTMGVPAGRPAMAAATSGGRRRLRRHRRDHASLSVSVATVDADREADAAIALHPAGVVEHGPPVAVGDGGAADERAGRQSMVQHGVELGAEQHDAGDEEEPAEQRDHDGERAVRVAGPGDVPGHDPRSQRLQGDDGGGGDEDTWEQFAQRVAPADEQRRTWPGGSTR